MLRTLRRVADRRRHAEGDHAHLFRPYHGDEVVALDCETTSADPRHAEHQMKYIHLVFGSITGPTMLRPKKNPPYAMVFVVNELAPSEGSG